MKIDTYLIIAIIAILVFVVYLFDLVVLPHRGVGGIDQIAADIIMMLLTGGIAYFCYDKYKNTA